MILNDLTELKINKTISNVSQAYQTIRHQEKTPVALEKIDVKFVRSLQKMGWKKGGIGAYSSIFIHPTKPYVLKVNRRQDLGFDNYVHLIKKFRNSNFPKISDKQEIMLEGQKYGIYLIEKLYSISRANGKAENYSDLISLLITNSRIDQDFENEYLIKDIKKFPKKYPKHWSDLLNLNPEIAEATKIIGKLFASNERLVMDMHGKNIMQRQNGTVVIIDPYTNW